MIDSFKGNSTPNGPILTQYKTFKTVASSHLKQKEAALSKMHKM